MKMLNNLLERELEDLEEIVLDEEDIEGVKKKIKITDLESANWAFRKLKAIENKKKQIEDLAKKEIEPYKLEISRIEEWKDAELKSYDRSINFFNFLLEEYYREQRKIDGKFKLSTPYGKVTSRKQQDKWNYEEDRLLPYIENYSPELIKVKKEVNKADFKKAVNEGKLFIQVDDKVLSAETGEYLEGITIEERETTVKVEVLD